MNDEDRLRALRAFELDDVPSLSNEGGENIMETIESRIKEIGSTSMFDFRYISCGIFNPAECILLRNAGGNVAQYIEASNPAKPTTKAW